ncbi:MAG: hypothetical protein KDD19_03755 [Phaeodactylibacter sp.]|nr:hypothetical protein [Phaeodactylibacter sp.]MCB9049650.1 hypothetical protein [Lewinellaceae bacterium]
MKTSFAVLIILHLFFAAFAQEVYWQGGTPGRETDWMEPQNWVGGQVPAWKDIVIVPYQEHRFYPEVGCVAPLIQSLKVNKGASLTIAPGGVLSVDAAESEEDGILLEGFIFNFGALILTEMELESVENQLAHLDNQGVCSLVTDMGHIPLTTHDNQ